MKLRNLLTINYHIPEVINNKKDDYHDNFGFQWNKFNKLQLDSFNGSTESYDRLIDQSQLSASDFKNKSVLEVGAGNGRFTEVLLKLGAKVVSVDYSSAIYANFENNNIAIKNEDLICIQSDMFDMPVKEKSFDIVICYGVIQHTGRNEDALNHLVNYVSSNGKLLVDIYSNSLRHFNPWIYAIRPFFSRIKSNEKKFNFVKNFVNFIFPIQLYLLKLVYGKGGIYKYIRYFLYRAPNSVYGINLYLSGKISLEHAKDWSLCDTFDAWMPKHDHPVSMKKWKSMISDLASSRNLDILCIKECGQGNCASLKITDD